MSENRKLADNAGFLNNNKNPNDCEEMMPAEHVVNRRTSLAALTGFRRTTLPEPPAPVTITNTLRYLCTNIQAAMSRSWMPCVVLTCLQTWRKKNEPSTFFCENGETVLGFYRFYINNFDTPAFAKKLLNAPEGFPVILQLECDLERTSCGMPTDMFAIDEFKALGLAIEEAKRRRRRAQRT